MNTIYGLIGRKLGHSFSQRFFTEKFAAEGVAAEYRNFEIDDISRIKEIVAGNPQLRGLNVTFPYKTEVMPLLDNIDDNARRVGAVNVIAISRNDDGTFALCGYNTDIIGFADMLEPLALPAGTKALVLGTGGASRAVIAALNARGVEVTRVSRHAAPGLLTYQQLTKPIIEAHTVVVNATPLGTYPDTSGAPDIPYHLLDGRHICIDLVYNPAVTQFMARCAEHGALVRNGLHMLVSQAIASYKIWNS